MSIQHSTESLRTIRQDKNKIKCIQVEKEEVKILILLIIYIKKPRDTTKKLLDLINAFSKLEEYKINTLI